MPEPDDRAMRRQTIVLPGVAPGVRREIHLLGFGRPGARPKAYLQAGLHADELPGCWCCASSAGSSPGARR